MDIDYLLIGMAFQVPTETSKFCAEKNRRLTHHGSTSKEVRLVQVIKNFPTSTEITTLVEN